MGVKIRVVKEDELALVVEMLNNVPEFDDSIDLPLIMGRLNKSSIVLVAEYAKKIIGCKIAYNRYYDGSIYSWLGGVLPVFRKQGVAHELQLEMERMAKRQFYNRICMKTRNKFPDMIRFAISHGYQITDFEKKEDNMESRIILSKTL